MFSWSEITRKLKYLPVSTQYEKNIENHITRSCKKACSFTTWLHEDVISKLLHQYFMMYNFRWILLVFQFPGKSLVLSNHWFPAQLEIKYFLSVYMLFPSELERIYSLPSVQAVIGRIWTELININTTALQRELF